LAVVQEGSDVLLLVSWPDGIAGPGQATVAAFTAMGAEVPAPGRLLLRWPRVVA
jgi:hypothetical protein